MKEKHIEKYILLLYSIYQVSAFVLSVYHEIPSWISFLLLTSLVFCWMLSLEAYKNYRFRAVFSTIVVQLSMLFYMYGREKMVIIIPMLITLCIISGLYGIKEPVMVSMFFNLLHVFIYGIVLGNFMKAEQSELYYHMVQLLNLLVAEILVYVQVKENKRNKESYYKMINELKVAEKSKDEFLANVTHEIRTPVNTICGMSEVVLQEKDPQKMREYLFCIQSAGHNLMSVVSDILDFSELQSGKTDIVNEAYNITSTINDVINMSMSKLNDKNVELIIDCDSMIPCGLMGDAKKLQRVMMNLISNSVKYTEKGGITLLVSHQKEESGISLSVTVKDTGTGITEEKRPGLFADNSQSDNWGEREEGEDGLGISISKALVEAMGGKIIMESEAPKGASVHFTIPQVVFDERPIIWVRYKEKYKVAIYINMEQLDNVNVREDYSQSICHMMEQLKIKNYVCRNLVELKEKEAHNAFTHIFISLYEYMEDMAYFDELALHTKVAVLILRTEEKYLSNPDLIRVYKPFYVLSLVSVLRGTEHKNGSRLTNGSGQFIAPDVNILVVDDNSMNITVIEKLLENYQITVTKATSGQMALEKIEEKKYDFVFMDHMMPQMDGIETLHRIRKKPGLYCKSVPIIALTANAVAGAREMFSEEGFSDFLEKPVTITALERMLKRTLPKDKIIFIEETEEETEVEQERPLKKRKLERKKHKFETVIITNGKEESEENEKKIMEQPVKETPVREHTGHSKTVERKEMKPEPQNQTKKDGICIGDLDVKSGCMYCGGEEGYISVLEMHLESTDDNRKQLTDLFEQENWKDYTIAVHAIKSFMLSIGAAPLSGMAKGLEFAGKDNNIAYIKENHEAMLKEYDRVTEEIREHELFRDKFSKAGTLEESTEVQKLMEQEEAGSLPELPKEGFDIMTTELINAMYDLEAEKMMTLLNRLEGYQYHGKVLAKELAPIRRKVEMCDYISAADAMEKIKEKIKECN